MDRKLKITVLGGQEQVGLNSTVIEAGNDLVLVDLGNNFEDQEFGVDYYIPNIDSLFPKIDQIRGLLVTHGHYDHRAAIPFLIDKLGNPPIYGSAFTLQLIKRQLKEFRTKGQRFLPLKPRQEINLGKIHVQAVHLTHSIVGTYGYFIKTLGGNIFHTGDFKFDDHPFNEQPSDYETLEKIRQQGVDVLMIDSTRANREDHSRSETSITQNLEKLIKEAPGRIIVSTFAQMLNRIYQIGLIGKKYHRQIFIKGLTLEKTTTIGKQMGILGKDIKLKDAKEMKKYPEDQILLFATGSQGEEEAALTRMLKANKGIYKIKSKDTIILSSSTIPSNILAIQKLIDRFADRGCRVFTDDIIDIHAGGHGHQQEIKRMIELLNPRCIFPIEGYISFRHRLAQLTHTMGYSKNRVILAKNGEPVIFDQQGYRKLDYEKPQPGVIMSRKLIKNGAELINQRKRAARHGLLTVFINAKTRRIDLSAWGVPFEVINKLKTDLKKNKIPQASPKKIKEVIEKFLSLHFDRELIPAIKVEIT